MATAAVLHLPFVSLTATPEPPPLKQRPERRRTSREQGMALEILGHAIEYLVDSRLPEGGLSIAENQAVRMLMGCSREVFEASADVVPVFQRLHGWRQWRMRKRTA